MSDQDTVEAVKQRLLGRPKQLDFTATGEVVSQLWSKSLFDAASEPSIYVGRYTSKPQDLIKIVTIA